MIPEASGYVSGAGLWKCARTGLIKEHQLLLLESGREFLEQGKPIQQVGGRGGLKIDHLSLTISEPST